MSATDFLPRRQADLLLWSSHFNNQIGANFEAYGLTFEQASDYNQTHNAYAAAYAMAFSNSTNSTGAILKKRDAERALRRLARQLARQVKATRSVDRVARQRLGLTLRNRGGWHPRAPKPTTAPGIQIEMRDGRRIRVRLLNHAEESRRGRPRRTSCALFMVSYENAPPADPRDWSLVGMTGKTIATLQLPLGIGPETPIWLTACWMSTMQERGPFAQAVPLHMHLYSNPPLPGMTRNMQLVA